MVYTESGKLCVSFTADVLKMFSEIFYNKFNLIGTNVYSEFYFKELMEIFHLPGMDQWPDMVSNAQVAKEEDSSPKICFSLVCFAEAYLM
jgi:hypothetical protein